MWAKWKKFTQEWLKRSRRKTKLDDLDRFISLWIAFNGWMRAAFGEHLDDASQRDKVKKLDNLRITFDNMVERNPDFRRNLDQLRKHTIANMRYPDDEDKIQPYDETFESFIDILYQVQNNLFHGRENPADYERDFKLASLLRQILYPLFNTYLELYEPDSF